MHHRQGFFAHDAVKDLFPFAPRADQDIRITATAITGRGAIVRCDAYTASGAKVAGGILRPHEPVNFLGAAGQIYYVEVVGGASSYELELAGAPYALAADSSPKGVHVQGKATPFYFHVPADIAEFNLTVSSGAPGETSLNRLYAPSGKLVRTLDTQIVPVVRETLKRAAAGGDWEGFLCLSLEKAPKGGFDDVYVVLDRNLSPWFILDPRQPVMISALKTQK